MQSFTGMKISFYGLLVIRFLRRETFCQVSEFGCPKFSNSIFSKELLGSNDKIFWGLHTLFLGSRYIIQVYGSNLANVFDHLRGKNNILRV